MTAQHLGHAAELRSLSHQRPEVRPPDGYARLMRVTFRHDYYNADGDLCPDLSVLPTSETADRMASIGLLLLRESCGFSILYDRARATGLIEYLRRQWELIGPGDYYPLWTGGARWHDHHSGQRIGTLKSHLKATICAALAEKNGDGVLAPLLRQPVKDMDIKQYWTRLRFVLVNNNPLFTNMTELPLTVNPSAKNLFFINTKAHSNDTGLVYLNSGQSVSGTELLSVRTASFAWEVPDGDGVLVRDVSGRVVLDLPAVVPKSLEGSDPANLTGPMVRQAVGDDDLSAEEDAVRWHMVQINLTNQPEDCYVLETTNSSRPSKTVLYTISKPLPMGFVDLLFSNPTGTALGVYPIKLEEGLPLDEAITPISYCLNFQARRTYWTYVVIPTPGRDDFLDLRIESLTGVPVVFNGPEPVVLPNGERAYAFVSQEPIVLRQQSNMRFRLLGRRRSQPEDETVLVSCLPVASVQQVRAPARGVSLDDTAYSDIYVHI